MLVLPKDTWDLFSVSVENKSGDWVARFLGHSPLIYCRSRWSDLFDESDRWRSGLLREVVWHEILHYLHIMHLLPTQVYYWMWLSSFMELNQIIHESEGSELYIDDELKGRLRIPPSPLEDDISIFVGDTKVDYEALLEGLVIADQLHDKSCPEIKERFVRETVANAKVIETNIRHIIGFQMLAIVLPHIGEIGLTPADVLTFINYFCILDESYRVMLDKFFQVPSGCAVDERMHLCREGLKRGLTGFIELWRDRQACKEAIRMGTSLQAYLISLLGRKAAAYITISSNAVKHNHLAETIHLVAYLLASSFRRLSVALSREGESALVLEWAKQGGISVPCIMADGSVVDFMNPSEQRRTLSGPPAGVTTWIRFAVGREITKWVVAGGNLVCPFYRFFSTNFGEEGMGNLKQLCNQIYLENIETGNFSPCGSYCSWESPVLNIMEVPDKKSKVCFFWNSVRSIFKKFDSVRQVCD